jgi:hypothetical protein
MRLYDREEFERDIQARWGLKGTEQFTATTRLWQTRSGKFISIPQLESYPDYWLDDVKLRIEASEKLHVPWRT